MVSIPACHAGDPGSIPGLGVLLFFFFCLFFFVGGASFVFPLPDSNAVPGMAAWSAGRYIKNVR